MMDLTIFKLDIDDLLEEFTQGKYSTLADMKRVWMAMKFSYIYQAKPAKNAAFFMQSLFAHALSHMVSQGDLSRRLGGLYCLYCLYETQPYKPAFKIYLSLEELRRLKTLVVDAKENGTEVALALVKRMLEKNMFLFGATSIAGGTATLRVDEVRKLQEQRVQIAYEKLFANSRIEDYLHMDLAGMRGKMYLHVSETWVGYWGGQMYVALSHLCREGAELEMKELMKISAEYTKAKELAIKEASNTVDVEDIKHIAENKKLVGDMVSEIVEEWDARKEEFYKQTGTSRSEKRNQDSAIVPFQDIEEELLQLMDE